MLLIHIPSSEEVPVLLLQLYSLESFLISRVQYDIVCFVVCLLMILH